MAKTFGKNWSTLALIAGSVGVFATLAIQMVMVGGLEADQAILAWFRVHESDFLTHFFRLVTLFGDFRLVALLGLFGAAYLVRKKARLSAVYLVLVIAGVTVINAVIKEIFDRPRPDAMFQLTSEHGFSFPSGHASKAMALYCAMVWIAWREGWLNARMRIVGYCLAIDLALLVAVSRMYLRVHYFSDVMAGLALGVFWMVAMQPLVLSRFVSKLGLADGRFAPSSEG